MNNEHDELLDDLINYYDSENDDFGDTTVISTVKAEKPAEELLGDTLVMDVPSQPSTNASKDTEETTVINIPASTEPVIPQDEVLGSLYPDKQSSIPQQSQINTPKRIDIPKINNTTQRTTSVPPTRKKGIWYTLKPLWATIIVCAMLVGSYFFYVTDTGIIGIYKSNFAYNFSLIMRVFGIDYNPVQELPVVGDNNPFVTTAHAEGNGGYNSIKEKLATIPFAGADTACFEKYNNGVVCAKSNYLCFITKKGEKKWEQKTQISNPLLSVSGKYIAVAGKDSKYLSLYKDKKLLYSTKVSDKIKSCSVSEKGDVAIVTDKTAYKGAVSVYNKKGEEVFSWVSGVNYITSAAMLKSRNVAISLVSTENNVKSYVMLFDIYEKDPLNGTEFTDSLIFDSAPFKKDAYVCADNAISCVNSDGELEYSIRFDNMDITHTASDAKGWRAVSYTEKYLPYINIYNHKGSSQAVIATESNPDYIDLYKSVILYNNGRDVICGKADKTKTRYSAPMTVQALIMMNNNTYMVAYENSIEIIRI